MNIQLDKNYRIESDSLNLILRYEAEGGKEYVDKKGEVKRGISRDEWYFPNIELLLKKYLTLTLNDDNANDVKDLLSIIEQTKKTIEKFFKEYGTRVQD